MHSQGKDLDLRVALNLAADHGGFTLTGQTLTLALVRRVQGDVGTFTLTGQDASVFANVKMTADAGTFALTGQDVTEAITEILNVGQFSADSQDNVLELGVAVEGFELKSGLGTVTVFGVIIPSQTPIWAAVVPAQTPVWTEVA